MERPLQRCSKFAIIESCYLWKTFALNKFRSRTSTLFWITFRFPKIISSDSKQIQNIFTSIHFCLNFGGVQTCLFSRFSYDIPHVLHAIYSNSLDALGIIVMHWDKNLQWSWTAHRSLDKAQKCIVKSLKLPGVMTAKKSC